MDTLIENIAKWVFELRFDDLPQHLIEKAQLQILNIIAAVISGTHCDPLKPMGSLDLPDGESTVLPTGRKTNAEYAVFVNALYSMSFDFDDYLFMGHTGHSSVLVPLALSEEKGLAMNDVILSQVIANEVEGRLGASVLLGPHNGQMWSYIHTVGAAAAASKLLGQSKEQIASAISLSLYQPNYPLPPGFMLSDSKLLTASIPILSGMLCAKLAQNGMKGNVGLLEAEHGFLSRFAYLPLPHMISGFGRWWVTDTIAFKPYPGCAYIDTAVDCIYKIMGEYRQKTGKPITPEGIKHVGVFANVLTVGMNAMSQLYDQTYDNGTLHPVNINFSIPKSLAIALIHGSLQAGHLSSEMLLAYEREIKSLSQRIELFHEWRYTLKMQSAFYESIGGKFILNNSGILKLIKAFRRIKKDTPSLSLKSAGLLKAWFALSDHEKKAIKNGIRRKGNHVKMDEFVFSFGARVKLVTKDGQIYEAESIIPRGASSKDRKVVVMDKLASALGSDQKAKSLSDLLNPEISVKEFVKHIAV